jgi:DNA-binding NarL/FixJ family response regulator
MQGAPIFSTTYAAVPAEGRSSKEIAELLSISPATVETHRAHLLQKLGLHNTVEVVRYATRRGIIQ